MYQVHAGTMFWLARFKCVGRKRKEYVSLKDLIRARILSFGDIVIELTIPRQGEKTRVRAGRTLPMRVQHTLAEGRSGTSMEYRLCTQSGFV